MPYPQKTDRIVTFDDWDDWTRRGYTFEGFIKAHWRRPMPARDQIILPTVRAYVSWGRWVADCPTDCGGALLVTPADPLYFCPHCGSGWHRLVFPGTVRRRAIEQLLMRRPLVRGMPNYRNWQTHETVAQLVAENAARGID